MISSILITYAIEEASQFKAAKIEKIAHIMNIVPKDVTGEDAIKLFLEYLRQKTAKNDLPARLKDVQLSIEELSLAVEDVNQIDIVNKLPRSMTTDDIFDFIKRAY